DVDVTPLVAPLDTGVTGSRDALTYSIIDAAVILDRLGVSINANTGVLTGPIKANASQLKYPDAETTKGKYTFKIRATDNGTLPEITSRLFVDRTVVYQVSNPAPASLDTVGKTINQDGLTYTGLNLITEKFPTGFDDDGDTVSIDPASVVTDLVVTATGT